MEKKAEKLLRKIHIKDYTNSLEKILEKKDFSTDAKNLLLSMFYKIENSYQDYKNTKVNVDLKQELFEKLLNIVQNKCKEILITNEEIDIKKKIDFKIEKDKGKIIALGNELVLLKGIIELGQNPICFAEEQKLVERPIGYVLNLGNKMNQTEVIRDFNGWSWDISIKDVDDLEINLIFQNLIYLFGNEFITQWINNKSKLADYLILAYENLKENFGEERANIIIKILCKLSIEISTQKDKETAKFWKDLQQKTKMELEKLENKKQYLEDITNEKKKLSKQIDKIDKILNNKELLKEEYDYRNSKLANIEKIFSTRNLANKLQIERQEYIEKIKEYNILIDPKGYVDRKEEISKKNKFLSILNVNSNKKKREDILIKLCTVFLECFKINIAKASSKQMITDYIYQLRYYRFLRLNEETSLKDIQSLKEKFNEISVLLLKKAKKLNAIEDITNDEKINYEIISKIFDSKMIELKNMVIETKVEDGRLFVEYYDTNILETVIEINSDRTVKLNKKTKLFI